MAYCTIAQLEERLTAGILNTRLIETGDDRARVLEAYIRRASARMDARLSVRHDTPCPQSPLLEDICISLVAWQIEADRGTAAKDMPPSVQVPYDEAMKILVQLSDGSMAIPGVVVDSEASAAGLQVAGYRSQFSPDSPGMECF